MGDVKCLPGEGTIQHINLAVPSWNTQSRGAEKGSWRCGSSRQTAKGRGGCKSAGREGASAGPDFPGAGLVPAECSPGWW